MHTSFLVPAAASRAAVAVDAYLEQSAVGTDHRLAVSVTLSLRLVRSVVITKSNNNNNKFDIIIILI